MSRPSRARTSTSSSTTRIRRHERRPAVSGRTSQDLLRFAAHHLGGPGPLSRESDSRKCSSRRSPLPAAATGWAGSCASQEAGGSSSTPARWPVSSRCCCSCRTSASASPRCRIRAAGARRSATCSSGSALGIDRRPDFKLEPEQLAAFGGSYSGDGIEVEVRARGRSPERGGDLLRPALWRERRLSPGPRPTGRRARVRGRRRRVARRAAHVPAGRLRLRRRARRAYGVTASIAAGHPATAEAGIELLAAGGTAADAAVARHSRRVSRRPS